MEEGDFEERQLTDFMGISSRIQSEVWKMVNFKNEKASSISLDTSK